MKKIKFMSGTLIIIFGIIMTGIGTYLTIEGKNRNSRKSQAELRLKIDSLKLDIEQKNAEIIELKKWESKISLTLLKQLNDRLQNLLNSIFTNSTYVVEDKSVISEGIVKKVCQDCLLNKNINAKKYISRSPLILGDITLKEDLFRNWIMICNHIDEINSVSSFMNPKTYDLVLRIKKSDFSLTANILIEPINNTTLEAWSSQIYQLLELSKELNNTVQELTK